jgi:hypothetical protein
MASSHFESDYIYGLHDPGGEAIMLEAGRTGWIVFTEEIGHNPDDGSGKDFRPYASRSMGVICRLNNGYFPNGTIPHSSHYEQFAQRCARYVAASQGCKIWIIGNEPNYVIERPHTTAEAQQPGAGREPVEGDGPNRKPTASSQGWRRLWSAISGFFQSFGKQSQVPRQAPAPSHAKASVRLVPAAVDDPFRRGLPQRYSALDPGKSSRGLQPQIADVAPRVSGGEAITPELYVRCFQLCREAIRRVPGHQDDQVLIAPVAPWNNQTPYPGNPAGDWVDYFRDLLILVGPSGCDGFALHAYTHSPDPKSITSEARMQPPFQHRRYEFRVYRDFLEAVPPALRQLPVYITETDQGAAWEDRNSGWVQQAYAEIDGWNHVADNQKVRALVLYRWPRYDKWYIDGKQGVIDDFRQAVRQGYRWRGVQPPAAKFKVGDLLYTTTIVNLRRTPGHIGKGAGDVLAELPQSSLVTVLDRDPRSVDGLWWWRVRAIASNNLTFAGWLAQAGPDGVAYLIKKEEPGTPPPGSGQFKSGDRVRTLTIVRMRRSPGYAGKAPEDVLAEFAAGSELTVIGGPQTADGLIWWQLRGSDVQGMTVEGWMAEKAPGGAALLEKSTGTAPPPPGEPPPKFKAGDLAETVNFARLRRTPGILNKPADDVVADIWQGTTARILGGPQRVDDLIWWHIETTNQSGQSVQGWMAETAPGGIPLLAPKKVEPQLPFLVGELIQVYASPVRVRKTPGHVNKPDDDILGELPPRATVNLIEGPQARDGLRWWRGGGIDSNGHDLVGWMAEATDSGIVLLARPSKLPGASIPEPATGNYLGQPYEGRFGIGQLWGENPAYYSRIIYDGVPLKGHHGIDFLTPPGTKVLAVEAGAASLVGFDPGGFGYFVLLAHPWGESVYAHLDRILVQQGQHVGKRGIVGLSGNSGDSSGPHLHVAIRIHPYVRADGWGGYADPLPYLDPKDVIMPPYVLDAGWRLLIGNGPEAIGPQGMPFVRMTPSGLSEETAGIVRP